MHHHTGALNSLLTSSPTDTPVPIDWDVRYSPRHTARVAGRAISTQHLTQLATRPAVTTLRIISDLLMEGWVISAYNPTGVTVEDILSEIHRGLRAPLTHLEWERTSPAKQARIQSTFYARCEASRDYDRTLHGGVRRMDCLLNTTVFVGLSSLTYRDNRWEAVLTLSRDFSAHSRGRCLPGT